MKAKEKTEGNRGMLTAFRKLARGRKKITLIGCLGWCNQFAELLGYVLRDAGAGWDKLIDFDYLIDADMEVITYGFN